MQLQQWTEKGKVTMPCQILEAKELKTLTSPLATKILYEIESEKTGISIPEISRRLKQHEQKIYYHVKQLMNAKIIEVDHEEKTNGPPAKIFRLSSPAFAVKYGKFIPSVQRKQIPKQEEEFFSPFIQQGRLDAKIVLGSPDPHGPEGARSRDAGYAIDLGIILGTYLQYKPKMSVIYDTELHDWNENLIIVGGPVVNKVAERINPHSPISYNLNTKTFVSENEKFDEENIGIITKFENPFAKGKWILYIAGKRYIGTHAAIISLSQNFPEICKKRDKDGTYQVIIHGVDANSDGIIDKAKIS